MRIGIEATDCSRWVERQLTELGFELWVRDPAQIRAERVKKQKFDREDAGKFNAPTVTTDSIMDGTQMLCEIRFMFLNVALLFQRRRGAKCAC